MFEGVVSYLLNRFLGKYVQNLDSSNLNVSIFKGKITQLLIRGHVDNFKQSEPSSGTKNMSHKIALA